MRFTFGNSRINIQKQIQKSKKMPKPRSLFSTKTFYILSSIVISAIAPNISEMAKSGVTVERALLLLSTLCGSGVMVIDRMEKEKNVYTPNWIAGRNQVDAVANTLVKESSIAIVKDVIQDAIASPVQAIQDRAQTIINTAADINPVQDIINDAIANPIGIITNPIGEVESVAKKSLFQVVGNLFK